MLSFAYMLFAPTDHGKHTKPNNHVKYCLHAFRAYMTESIQSEIIVLSIAYMLFAHTDYRKHPNRNNHVKYCLRLWHLRDRKPTSRNNHVKYCLQAFRAYMAESIQIEVITLSIAYMFFRAYMTESIVPFLRATTAQCKMQRRSLVWNLVTCAQPTLSNQHNHSSYCPDFPFLRLNIFLM